MSFDARLLGMGLLVTWSASFVRRSGIGIAVSAIDVHTLFYTFLAAACLGILAWSLCRSGHGERMTGRAMAADTTACLAMTCATLVDAGVLLAADDGATLLACAVGAAGYGAMLVRWGLLFCGMRRLDGVANALLAFAFHAVSKIVLACVPHAACVAVVACLPAVSLLCLVGAERRHGRAPIGGRTYSVDDLKAFWKVALGVLLYGLLLGMRRGLDIQIAQPVVIVLTETVCACCLVVALAWFVLHGSGFRFTRVFQVLLLLFATGFVLYPFMGDGSKELVAAFFSMGVELIFALIWIASVDIARHSSEVPPLTVLAGVWLLYSAPRPLGAALAERLTGYPDGLYSLVLPLVMIYCVVVASAFLLGAMPPGVREVLEKPLPMAHSAVTLDSRCAEVAARFGLTDREREVMFLLCQGRTKNYIAETMLISVNTVKSYAKNLYAKLGVHTIDELIDLVK